MSKVSSPAIFLHGLAGHGGEWQAVSELLDGQTAAPDLPGHGTNFDRSSPIRHTLSSDELVNAAVSLLRNFAEGTPAVLVGQSMGGLVAMRVAQRVPELLSHLVLIEADTGIMTPGDLTALQDWFDRWPPAFVDEEEATRFFGIDRRSTPAWVAGLQRTQGGLTGRFDPAAMLTVMEDLAGIGSSHVWRKLTTACTLILGEQGTTSTGEIESMLTVRPDTNVVRIADAGHDVHLDQPAKVAAAVADVMLM